MVDSAELIMRRKMMNKEEFVRRAAANQGNTITETRYWVDLVLEELKMAVIDEEKVSLYGFGSFEHRQHKGRTMKNFEGEEFTCPDSTMLKFVPSIYLRDAVKDGIGAVEFERRMEKIRALKRGEYVPGAYVTGGRLGKFDQTTGERLPRDFET
jgi:nucleoid DNA-binding protein